MPALPRIAGLPLTAAYYGAFHPLALIAVVGFVFHPSWMWGLAVAVAVISNFAVQAWFDCRVSADNLEAAKRDFTDPGGAFALRAIDGSPFFNAEDFTHIVDNQKRLRALIGEVRYQASLKESPWMWDRRPLKIFVATNQSGGVVGGAKAYVNPRGASLIFLSRHPDLLNANEQFVLMHELEHVSIRGAAQSTYIHASRIWGPIGVVFLCFAATSWFDWIVTALYALECIMLKGWYTMPIMREVIADNGGLRKLKSYADQKQVAEDTMNMYRDHLIALRPTKAGDRIMPFMKNAELTWRTKYLETFLAHLKLGQAAPALHFYQTTSAPFMILYVALFVRIGAVTAVPPLVPLIFAGAWAVWAFIQTSPAARRAVLANQAIYEYISANTKPVVPEEKAPEEAPPA